MLGLYLLAAHLLGDVVLQTRWQAEGKFDHVGYRLRHVLTYTVPFVPIAFAYASRPGKAVAFLCFLFVLHYLTDSRRFRSTPSEVLAWHVQARLHRFPEAARRCPPNPWPPMGILIDQALHVCQLAVLGAVLLS